MMMPVHYSSTTFISNAIRCIFAWPVSVCVMSPDRCDRLFIPPNAGHGADIDGYHRPARNHLTWSWSPSSAATSPASGAGALRAYLDHFKTAFYTVSVYVFTPRRSDGAVAWQQHHICLNAMVLIIWSNFKYQIHTEKHKRCTNKNRLFSRYVHIKDIEPFINNKGRRKACLKENKIDPSHLYGAQKEQKAIYKGIQRQRATAYIYEKHHAPAHSLYHDIHLCTFPSHIRLSSRRAWPICKNTAI